MPDRKNRSRKNRKDRKNRKANRKSRRNRRQSGGESMPAPAGGNPMAEMQAQSLSQGRQFAVYHANQHGGGLEAGPFPGSVTSQSLLPQALHASARIAPLDAAIGQIQNLKDQEGGRRGRKNRKASRKGRKGSRKNRKGSRKNRKGSRKNRKGSRKNRKASRKGSRKLRGGAYDLANAASVSAPGMLLSPKMEAAALSGMNAEWKLASDPSAFAPGYSKQ
jgi:hypothetical protein